MNTYDWYQTLLRPSWAPPAELFGPVWTVLYILIVVSFGYVAYLYFTKRLPFSVLLPFVLNLVFNLAFTPIEFGLRNLTLGSVDIILVLGTLIWAMGAIYRQARWVALINIPYLAWVSFATVLQLTVMFMNR